jgi:hypothetical protein
VYRWKSSSTVLGRSDFSRTQSQYVPTGHSFQPHKRGKTVINSSESPRTKLDDLIGVLSPDWDKDFTATYPHFHAVPNVNTFSLGLSIKRKNKVPRTSAISIFEDPQSDSMEIGNGQGLPASSPSPKGGDFGENSHLPCFSVKDDPIPRIDSKILCGVIDGRYKDLYDQCAIIDCRFGYEFGGGHIPGAININTCGALEKRFFSEKPSHRHRLLIIFHCEFSMHRGPRMYSV